MCSSCVILFGISITSTKYWPPSTIWRFLSELVLLLPNTDRLQQFEDFCQSLFYFYQILTAFNNLKIFVRDCSTSTKYWPPSTIRRFLSELFYFYQILIAFKNLNILSEVAHANCKRLKLFEGTGMFEFCYMPN
jgi:hypothetical protein